MACKGVCECMLFLNCYIIWFIQDGSNDHCIYCIWLLHVWFYFLHKRKVLTHCTIILNAKFWIYSAILTSLRDFIQSTCNLVCILISLLWWKVINCFRIWHSWPCCRDMVAILSISPLNKKMHITLMVMSNMHQTSHVCWVYQPKLGWPSFPF